MRGTNLALSASAATQEKLGIDKDGPENVVLMHSAVESNFDRLRLCVIPEMDGEFRVSWTCCERTLTRHARQGMSVPVLHVW